MSKVIACSCCKKIIKETSIFDTGSPFHKGLDVVWKVAEDLGKVAEDLGDEFSRLSQHYRGNPYSPNYSPSARYPAKGEQPKSPKKLERELFLNLKDTLQACGQWKDDYNKFRYLCNSCITKLAVIKCWHCEKFYNLLNDSTVNKMTDFKQQFPKIYYREYAGTCPSCLESSPLFRCDKCKAPVSLSENYVRHYYNDADIKDALSPNHSDWKPNCSVLCKKCFIHCHNTAVTYLNQTLQRHPKWSCDLKLDRTLDIPNVEDLSRDSSYCRLLFSSSDSIEGYHVVKNIASLKELFETTHLDFPSFVVLKARDFWGFEKFIKQIGGNAVINFLIYHKEPDNDVEESKQHFDWTSIAGTRVSGDVVLVEKSNVPDAGISCPKDISKSKDVASTAPIPDAVIANKKFIIDGLNILRYVNKDNLDLRILLAITTALLSKNYSFECLFDAVTPFALKKMDAKNSHNPDYMSSADLFSHLTAAMPDMFMLVPGGIQADDFIISRADNSGASIVSNDRFREDRFKKYQWLNNSSRIIKGMVINTDVSLPVLEIQFPLAKNLSDQLVAFEKEIQRMKFVPEKTVPSDNNSESVSVPILEPDVKVVSKRVIKKSMAKMTILYG